MKLLNYFAFLLCIASYAQATWQTAPNIIANTDGSRFDDVFFLDNNIGWAANGSNASVHKTTDGGLTWSEQLNETDLGGSYYFRNINFLNNTIGFLGTLNGKFFKTINGGTTWTLVNNISPNPNALCGISTTGASTVYACGAYFGPAHIIKSTDSGNTWTYTDMTAHANALVEVLFLDENNGYASGRNNTGATIIKTTDGGATWAELYNSNITGEYIWKLQVLESNPNVIFGATYTNAPNKGKLVKSIDAGVTWTTYDAPESGIEAIGFIDENTGWMGGHTTGFHKTTNGGQTWTNLNIGSNLNRIFIVNNNLAYAAGTAVYKYTTQNLSTEDFEAIKRKPLDITLEKNPVENQLNISIHFTSDDNILIELYDSKGQFIKQLSRDTITKKENKTYSFLVDNLASGTYIIDFHNNTGRTTKKFIKL